MIFLYVFLYIVFGLISALAMELCWKNKIDKTPTEEADDVISFTLMVFMWPFMWPVFFGLLFVKLILKIRALALKTTFFKKMKGEI